MKIERRSGDFLTPSFAVLGKQGTNWKGVIKSDTKSKKERG